MAAELSELKSSFNKQSTEIRSLQTALKKALDENDELKRSVVSLKKKIEDHEGEINELYSQQDDLEQTHVRMRLKYMVCQKIFILQRLM